VEKEVDPFPCENCDEIFKSEALRDEHNEKDHKKELSLWICNTCDKKFTDEYHLKRHNARVHEGVKTVNCKYCSRSFFSPYDCKVHENKADARGTNSKIFALYEKTHQHTDISFIFCVHIYIYIYRIAEGKRW